MSLKVNDFFCGCGGVGLGFKKAGFEIAFACDFDKFAVQTYRHNIGNHVVEADIKKLSYMDIPYADVWAFGFPCQDLSVAGQKKGFKLRCKNCGNDWTVDSKSDTRDEIRCPECKASDYEAASRSGMFFEMMRLLDETKTSRPEHMPKTLFIENVKGLKDYIPLLVIELSRRGYKAEIELFNSKYWGVPQNRERFFIVAMQENINGFEFPQEQHETVPKLSTVLEDNVQEKYFIPDDKAQKILEQAAKRLQEAGQCHAVITPDRISKQQNGRRVKEDEEEMYTLTAQDVHGVIVKSEQQICDETGLLSPEGCGKTLRVGGGGA